MSTLLAGLVVAALVLIQCLIGGTRLLFSVPAYAVVSIAALLSVFASKSIRGRANQACLLSSTLFFGYILVRATLSPVEYLARTDLFMVLAAVMVYLLTAFHLSASKYRVVIVLSCVVLGLANLGIGAVQFTKGDNFMPFSFLQRTDYEVRASGFYVCPNHLAGFLEVVAVTAISLVCWGRWQLWSKVLIGYATLLNFVGIILTVSRGGFLAVFFGLLAFASISMYIVRKRIPHRFVPLVASIAIGFCILGSGVAYIVMHQDYVRTRAEKFTSDDTRLPMWRAGLQQFQLDPVWGTGSGTYLYYGRQFREPQFPRDPFYVHNDYIHLLAEYGLVGAGLFLVFLATHLTAGWKALKSLISDRLTQTGVQSNSLALVIGSLSAIAAYIVHSVVDFNLHIPANTLIMAFVFGIIANPGLAAPSASKEAVVSRGLRFALPALALWMLFAATPMLPGEYFAEKSRVARRDQKFTESVAFAEKALTYEKKNPLIYYYMGESKSEAADPYEGDPPSPEERQKLFSEAVIDYERGLQLFPQDEHLLLGISWALDGLRRYEEAEKYFARVLKADPNSAQVVFFYATHLQLWGKFAEAEAEYHRSLALLPNENVPYGLDSLFKATGGKFGRLKDPVPAPAPPPTPESSPPVAPATAPQVPATAPVQADSAGQSSSFGNSPPGGGQR